MLERPPTRVAYDDLVRILCRRVAAVLASARRWPTARARLGVRRPARSPMRDADRAFQATQQGRSMPLPQIERRVMPFMGGADYLGPELNGGTYRLKFMQNGR